MGSFFASLKGWILAAGAAAFAILIGLLKYFSAKAERMEEKARAAEAKVRQDAMIRERDNEIDREHSDARREADKDKRDGKIPKHLSDTDDWN